MYKNYKNVLQYKKTRQSIKSWRCLTKKCVYNKKCKIIFLYFESRKQETSF